jgi:hypothetical protein
MGVKTDVREQEEQASPSRGGNERAPTGAQLAVSTACKALIRAVMRW